MNVCYDDELCPNYEDLFIGGFKKSGKKTSNRNITIVTLHLEFLTFFLGLHFFTTNYSL